MRIALVSYEYPPDTADGGVATYVHQISRLLTRRGHDVEVFSGSPDRALTESDDGIPVHRVVVPNRPSFSDSIANVFIKRHQDRPFDVVEGVDRFAHCAPILKLAPEIPFVLKLHTPGLVLREINTLLDFTVPGLDCAQRGEILREQVRHFFNPYWLRWDEAGARASILTDPERLHAQEADEIVALCLDMADLISRSWLVERKLISVIPLPLFVDPALLSIPADERNGTVTYYGRLEYRKGVISLAQAIPHVLKRRPEARFRLIGRGMKSPVRGENMSVYLQKWLAPYGDAVEFVDGVPLEAIPGLLRDSDVCVFPSLWENFPYVVREAMAAARAVVATSVGGVKEIINSSRVGVLVPPQRPRRLARAIAGLLDDRDRRVEMGLSARRHIVDTYDSNRIMPLIEESYRRAVERRTRLGPRPGGS